MSRQNNARPDAMRNRPKALQVVKQVRQRRQRTQRNENDGVALEDGEGAAEDLADPKILLCSGYGRRRQIRHGCPPNRLAPGKPTAIPLSIDQIAPRCNRKEALGNPQFAPALLRCAMQQMMG
jgi:hypothetical protein